MKISFNNSKFRNDIVYYREGILKISLRSAAVEIGISPSTLSRIEHKSTPDVLTFLKICKWMKTDHKIYIAIPFSDEDSEYTLN